MISSVYIAKKCCQLHLFKKGLTILNFENTELCKIFENTELYKTLTSLSQKRVEILILILVLFIATIILLFINKFTKNIKSLSTIYIASIFIELSFALPIALNLSFQKDGPGPLLLQSLLTISGGLVVLLGYIENRRKNDIDELKNADEKIQRTQSSRYEKSVKSIELLSSKDTFSAISAVHNLCRLADEWIDEWINTPGETYRKSEQEAQAIINVLCTYIRESGKSNHGNYKDAVGETIMNEIYNRLDRSDNSHSLWGGLDFNFKGATFTFPIKLKKIAGVGGMDFKGCTFEEDLEISLLMEYNDSPREILLDQCIFKGSVTLGIDSLDRHTNPKPTHFWKKKKNVAKYVKMSTVSLKNTHFAVGSSLDIRRFSGEANYRMMTIDINGTLPSQISLGILRHAIITIDEKQGTGTGKPLSQKLSIRDRTKIIQCEDTYLIIPSENIKEIYDPDLS